MPPRSNWKGYLKLSLVSCPVALFPATSASEKVSFHLLNAATGNRLKQQYVDAETGAIVERQDRLKGYEIAKSDYVVVSDEELDKIEIESSHTIDIESFTPRSEVDPVYYDNHYFLAPDDKVGEEAFAVIRDAMRKRDVVGIARVVLYGRERMLVLEPRSKGLMGVTLHYDYEVRDDAAYFDAVPNIEIGKEMLELASHIIDTKMARFDPSKFKDRYQEAVVDLVRSKQAGRPAQIPHAPAPSNVVNLMDALRRSLGSENAAPEKRREKKEKSADESASAKAKAAAREPARREPTRKASTKGAAGKGRIRKAS
ncbi:Ku protein [Methylocapsa polymorpha]|uniref:Non-homologous end joining protein Ku n=1 Tax=Methylocapsa polymorpha TaxID=3080828 RepID=A0ABZ0HWK8_9HYPH|nr:Ku protein [Methylocapsa sp. RX1]